MLDNFLFFFCLVSSTVSFRIMFRIIKHWNKDKNEFCFNHKVIILISHIAVQILRYGRAI